MTSQHIKLSIAVALLVVAVGVLLGTRDWGGPAATLADQAYYYDVATGELFVADYGLQTPVTNPQRGDAKASGVIAHVFSCGDCANEAERFIGYLEYRDANPMAPDPVRIARKPADGKPKWVSGSGQAAQPIRAAPRERCGADEPERCHP